MPWLGEHSLLYRDKCLLCAPEGSLDLFLMLAYASIPFVGAVVAFPVACNRESGLDSFVLEVAACAFS